MTLRFLLDADVLVYAISGDSAAVSFLENLPDGVAGTSALALAQVEAGIAVDPAGRRTQGLALARMLGALQVAPFDRDASAAYGAIVAVRGFSRKHAIDHMIAAHAISLGSALVTNNARDFKGIDGLVLEPWR